MRTPKLHVADDGTRTWRVRYRNPRETSETFTREGDADTFARILGRGTPSEVADALGWLHARREQRVATTTFGHWFDTYVDQLTGVTPRTRADYQALRRRYFTHLNDIPVDLIARSHISAIVNDMDRAGRSRKTVRHVVHLLSSCFGLALDDGLVSANPCRRVRLPAEKIDAVRARFLTHEQAGALIEATPATYQPLVLFLFGTGLRWSEATAIEGRHVDLVAGTVRVEQAWKQVPGEGKQIGMPKTEKSRRTVNAAVPALAAAHALMRGPNDLLFVTPTGRPIAHSNFRERVWVPACRRAGLDPAPRIHDARHTHASWLISDGQQLEAVQDQLGHESILTTRKVYGHLQPALGVAVGKSASASLSRALSQAGDLGIPTLEPGADPDQ